MPGMPQKKAFLNSDDLIPGLGDREVGDFWRWAYSDILSNRNRSVLAEFIVGVALGVVDKPRVEWDAADLRYRGFKIEVKAAAYVQSWHQDKPSAIRFSIRKAKLWNPATGKYEGQPIRCADLYVFCLYPERDNAKANVLDIPAWDFYVVSTAVLNRKFDKRKSLPLVEVRQLARRCKVEELKAVVDDALHTCSAQALGKARGAG